MVCIFSFFLSLSIFCFIGCNENSVDFVKLIGEIEKKILDHQIKKSTNFSVFPPSFAKQKGLFESYLHFNFIGDEYWTIMRKDLKFIDSNMFVTNFVLTSMFETKELGLVELDEKVVTDAVSAILKYQDPSFSEGTPIYRFWPMVEVVSPEGKIYYESYPENLAKIAEAFPDIDKLGVFICSLFKIEKCLDMLDQLKNMIESGSQAFQLPSDIDDSSCNLLLGTHLYENRKDFPDLYNLWSKRNTDYTNLFSKIIDYSYQPSSKSEKHVTKIDPRSYFVMYDFLVENPNISLPMTWMTNLEETRKNYPYVGMPLNSNNVDTNVITNFLYGLTRFWTTYDKNNNTISEYLKKLYIDTTKYIIWGLENGRFVTDRPDLSFLYYPSIYEFFWFFCRTNFELWNCCEDGPEKTTHHPLPFPELLEIRKKFRQLAQTTITDYLNKTKNIDSKNKLMTDLTDDDYYYSWDGFLGDYGGKKRGEDRLFSTSVAINALLDTWTEKVNNNLSIPAETTCKYLKWQNNVPESVKNLIDGGISYLAEHILKFGESLENAFFSGSGKSMKDMSYFYPANYFGYLNGTVLHQFNGTSSPQNLDLITSAFIDDMNGIVSKSQYEEMLTWKWFQQSVALKNQGFENFFPFWSSPSMTYSMTMLSFAKYYRVINC